MKTPEKTLPAFAIVTASTRRGGIRITRVTVREIFDGLGAAMVEESTLRGSVTHFLPFSRLATKRAAIAPKLRAFLSRPVLTPAENPPRHEAGNDADGAGSASPYWYQREPEIPAENATVAA